jgi:hypothetical protein
MKARTTVRLFAALTIALLVSTLAAGCAQTPKKASSIPIQTAQTLPSGTIAGLELIDIASLPMGEKADFDGWQAQGGTPATAPTFKRGSYKVVAGSAHLSTAVAATSTANGIAVKTLTLQFDAAGTKALAAFTGSAAAQAGGVDPIIAVLLNGKVLTALPNNGPITDGSVQISGDQDAVETLIKAIAPTPL